MSERSPIQTRPRWALLNRSPKGSALILTGLRGNPVYWKHRGRGYKITQETVGASVEEIGSGHFTTMASLSVCLLFFFCFTEGFVNSLTIASKVRSAMMADTGTAAPSSGPAVDCMMLAALGFTIECPEMYIQEQAALKNSTTTQATNSSLTASTSAPPGPTTPAVACEDRIQEILGTGKGCGDISDICSSVLFASYCRQHCHLCAR